MIIRATEHEFIMIPQHDHSYLSGEFAAHFSKAFTGDDGYCQDFLTAVYEHDRSWIELDRVPIWNEQFQYPYSFMDYPIQPRLSACVQGLDEIEAKSEYAGLLCSLHYNSIMKNSPLQKCIEFYTCEVDRQQRIREKLRLNDDEEKGLAHHFRLLQYCDDLSLYVCLNEPGVDKDNEHPWYKDGFLDYKSLYSDQFVPIAKWINIHDIVIIRMRRVRIACLCLISRIMSLILLTIMYKDVRDQHNIAVQDNEGVVHYCPYYGTPIAVEDYRFCSKCGKEVSR